MEVLICHLFCPKALSDAIRLNFTLVEVNFAYCDEFTFAKCYCICWSVYLVLFIHFI